MCHGNEYAEFYNNSAETPSRNNLSDVSHVQQFNVTAGEACGYFQCHSMALYRRVRFLTSRDLKTTIARHVHEVTRYAYEDMSPP